MTTLTVPLYSMVPAAKIVHTGTADDAVTPVLMCAVWDDEAKRLAATDRYCVVSHELEGVLEGEETVAIPRDLLLWISRLKPRDYFGASLRITMQEEAVVAEVIHPEPGTVLASSSAKRITGNFPPIMRLIEGWSPTDDAAPVGIGAALLKRILTGLVPTLSKGEPIKLELGGGAMGTRTKSAPIRITHGKTLILIQPVTLVEGS